MRKKGSLVSIFNIHHLPGYLRIWTHYTTKKQQKTFIFNCVQQKKLIITFNYDITRSTSLPTSNSIQMNFQLTIPEDQIISDFDLNLYGCIALAGTVYLNNRPLLHFG